MRHFSKLPGVRWAVTIAAGAALVASLGAPAVATAATKTYSSLVTSVRYQVKAKSFVIKGRLNSKAKGKTIGIEIRKPGRAYWTPIATTKTTTSGYWHIHYTPQLGGKFYIRARYGSSSLSRTASITVKRGPGYATLIRLSSTTSTQDSGLFEALQPMFLAACPEYKMAAHFVGSGAAMVDGGMGNADVLLVHSPAAELSFLNGIVSGTKYPHHGFGRHSVMYNDFVLVGPDSNPAHILGSDSVKQAFQKIANTNSTFISRHDNSGTNAKELSIWASVGNLQSGQSWYKASSMGMTQALVAASNSDAYTLADRATWLNISKQGLISGLKIVAEGDADLFNQYSVIQVSGAKNSEGALEFSTWIRSSQAQTLIRNYGKSTFGRSLFVPNAGKY